MTIQRGEEKRSRSDLVTGTSDCSGSVSTGSAPNCMAVAAPVHCAPFALRAPSARIDWSELLKRIYDVDSLACSCGGRLQFIALILEEAAARAILESLGLASRAPPVARARAAGVTGLESYSCTPGSELLPDFFV